MQLCRSRYYLLLVGTDASFKLTGLTDQTSQLSIYFCMYIYKYGTQIKAAQGEEVDLIVKFYPGHKAPPMLKIPTTIIKTRMHYDYYETVTMSPVAAQVVMVHVIKDRQCSSSIVPAPHASRDGV
jgi:hypothetical protein